eukprot:UN12938
MASVLPKKKRKRSHKSYAKFIDIITKLGKDYDPSLFVCLIWSQIGVTCSICCADTNLKGFFTSHNKITDFNYSKFKKHCIVNCIHYKRIKNLELIKVHPLSRRKRSRDNDEESEYVESNEDEESEDYHEYAAPPAKRLRRSPRNMKKKTDEESDIENTNRSNNSNNSNNSSGKMSANYKKKMAKLMQENMTLKQENK